MLWHATIASVAARGDAKLDFMNAPERLESALASTSAILSEASFIFLGDEPLSSTPKHFYRFTGMPFPLGISFKTDK